MNRYQYDGIYLKGRRMDKSNVDLAYWHGICLLCSKPRLTCQKDLGLPGPQIDGERLSPPDEGKDLGR